MVFGPWSGHETVIRLPWCTCRASGICRSSLSFAQSSFRRRLPSPPPFPFLRSYFYVLASGAAAALSHSFSTNVGRRRRWLRSDSVVDGVVDGVNGVDGSGPLPRLATDGSLTTAPLCRSAAFWAWRRTLAVRKALGEVRPMLRRTRAVRKALGEVRLWL